MGLKKNQELLKSGALPKAEYDRRMRQRALSMEKKSAKKVVKNRQQMVVRAARSGRPNQISVARVSHVETALAKRFQADEAKEILNYVACLINPEDFQYRIPDAWPKPSALYVSSREFEVPLNTTGPAADKGRFAICAMPRLGPLSSVGNIAQWNIYTPVDGLTWSTADWTAEASYAAVAPDGTDLYSDVEIGYLVGEASTDSSAGTAVTSVAAGSYALTVTSSVLHWGDIFNYAVANSAIRSNTARVTFTSGAIIFPPTNANVNTAYITVAWSTGAGQTAWTTANSSTSSSSGLIGSPLALENSTVLNSTTSGLRSQTIRIQYGKGGALYDPIHTFAGTAPTAFTAFTLHISVLTQGTTTEDNTGTVSVIRPVAMSMLTSWRGEILHNAGNISCGLGDDDGLMKNWLTNEPSASWQGQLWETYAAVPNSKGRIYHSGPIDKGSYVWWAPAREQDTFYHKYDDTLTASYPPLFCSGRYVTTSGTNPDTVLRCRVTIIYEYQTVNPLIPVKEISRHSNALTRAMAVLDHIGLPHATENPIHALLAGLGIAGAKALLAKLGWGAASVAGATVGKLLSNTRAEYNSRSGLTIKTGGQ